MSENEVESSFEREWTKMFPIGDDGGLSPTAVQIARECFKRGVSLQKSFQLKINEQPI